MEDQPPSSKQTLAAPSDAAAGCRETSVRIQKVVTRLDLKSIIITQLNALGAYRDMKFVPCLPFETGSAGIEGCVVRLLEASGTPKDLCQTAKTSCHLKT